MEKKGKINRKSKSMSKCNRLSVSSFQNYVLTVEVKTLQCLMWFSIYAEK